jgi:predicted O-methyltransferase YrrM
MLEVLKSYAITHKVPIISDQGLALIKELFEKNKIKHVLEIGTAIGYSSLAMASFGAYVDTFERNPEMVLEAKKNFDLYDLNQQIKLYPYDALKYDIDLNQYDLIFIDAAKAQYQKFFEKFMKYLKQDGLILCDNLNFHHLNKDLVNRNTRQLLKKLESFKSFLINHPEFKTNFFDIGDGMSVSMRVKR